MKIVFFIFIIAGLFSCGVKSSRSGEINDGHNSRNALDWQGIYTGIIPCADCQGIETVIRLHSNGSYIKEARYKGKSPEVYKSEGNFTWSPDGNSITIFSSSGNIIYKAGENTLIQLDQKGNMISGSLADQYILRKADHLRDIFWKLIELNGQPILNVLPGKEPHLVLTSQGRVTGNGGCNSFNGGYEVTGGNKIRFSNVASTKMACMSINFEDSFFKIFDLTDNYTILNDTLSLNKAKMAPLAKFAAVYLR